MGRLASVLGASWDVWRASWRRLEASWEAKPSWSALGAVFGASWKRLETVLGTSWCVLEASWSRLVGVFGSS